MSTVAVTLAAMMSVASPSTPPPPLGLHSTPSKVVLTWKYMQRHDMTSRAAVVTCAGCHMVIVPQTKRFRGLTGVGYTPIPPIPLPATALLFGTALGGVVIATRKWRRT